MKGFVLRFIIRYIIFFVVFFSFLGCTNPFIRPAGGGGVYDDKPSEPITTEPMYRATMRPYTVMGKRYYPHSVKVGESFTGIASWYGDDFHDKQTSNGEFYNMYDMTAAHKTMPINTQVRVTNLTNNLSTIVRINDRGPFVGERIIDLSFKAATEIDMIKHGTARVKLEVLQYDSIADKYLHKKPQMPENKKSVETSQKSETYSIQIASFTSREKASKLKERCYNDHSNYKPSIKEVIINNMPIYKVMLGGFKDLGELREFIEREHFEGAFIVRN